MTDKEESVVLDPDSLFEDEVQDWSTINRNPLFKTSDESLPKREGKFFDQDGSKTQQERLEDSRHQMYLALLHIRGHHVKQLMVGVWIPSKNMAIVPHAKGSFFKDIGVAHVYTLKKKLQGMWLSPLEAVYLVERGSLLMYLSNEKFENFIADANPDFNYDSLPKLPLSHLYTLAFSGSPDLVDKYETYALLKRLGYLILEAKPDLINENEKGENSFKKSEKNERTYFHWQRLLSNFISTVSTLIKNLHSALYFGTWNFQNYTLVYHLLQIIPTHKSKHLDGALADSRYTIAFDVWKPCPTFSKKTPPIPDYQVGIVNVAHVPFPSISILKAFWGRVRLREDQFRAAQSKTISTKSTKPVLKKSTPKFVSKKEERLKKKLERESKLDPKIRKRNEYLSKKDKLLKAGTEGTKVVLAVIDTGVINFSTFNETDFTLSSELVMKDLNELEERTNHGIIWNEEIK